MMKNLANESVTVSEDIHELLGIVDSLKNIQDQVRPIAATSELDPVTKKKLRVLYYDLDTFIQSLESIVDQSKRYSH